MKRRNGSQERVKTTNRIAERLAAASSTDLNVDRILAEVLPEQKSFLQATAFVERHQNNKTIKQPLSCTIPSGTRSVASLTESPFARMEALAKYRHERKHAMEHSNASSLVQSVEDYNTNAVQHALLLWEDKFHRRVLSIPDIVLLLVRHDVIQMVESVGFFRCSRLSLEQLMELELSLPAIFNEQNERRKRPLWQRLCRAVWSNGRAFRSSQRHRHAVVESLRPLSPNRIELEPLHPSKAKQMHKPHSPSKRRSLPEEEERQERVVHRSSAYIRDHCVEEILALPFPVLLRKRYACEKLMRILWRQRQLLLRPRLLQWHEAVLWLVCQDKVRRYCQLKSALRLMQRARIVLSTIMQRQWQQWRQQREQEQTWERLAATVTVQSIWRMHHTRQRIQAVLLHRSIARIQAHWRGFYCRKMLTRQKRYHLYTNASIKVQRAYRAYTCRCRFQYHFKRYKASMVLTRSIRAYAHRRKMSRLYKQRLARLHAAILIQLWFRTTMERVRTAQARKAKQYAAACRLQRFFRDLRLAVVLRRRVQRRVAERYHAAVTIQQLYRGKQARARFHALKDQLEAQKRQDVLRIMWENAYATRIQTAWRNKQKRKQQKIRA